MDKPLQVVIYGIGAELAGGCPRQGQCSGTPRGRCGGHCSGQCCRGGGGTAATVGRLYRELAEQLRASPLAAKVELRFVDLFEHPAEQFPELQPLLTAGYEPPLTVVNGTMQFYGGIDSTRILHALASIAGEA